MVSVLTETGSYRFFIDFQGNADDPWVLEVLEKVKAVTGDLTLMGCYREKWIK